MLARVVWTQYHKFSHVSPEQIFSAHLFLSAWKVPWCCLDSWHPLNKIDLFLIPVVSPNRQDSATLLDNDIVDDTSGDFKQLMRSAAMVSLQGICNLVGKHHQISREDNYNKFYLLTFWPCIDNILTWGFVGGWCCLLVGLPSIMGQMQINLENCISSKSNRDMWKQRSCNEGWSN